MIEAFKGSLGRLLLHPVAIFAGLIAGGTLGWLDKGQIPILGTLGEIYIRLLQMCVIPLLFTAVATSLSRLFLDGAANRYFTRLVLLVVGGLAIAGALGVALGYWGQPGGELQLAAREVIGKVIFTAEASSGALAPTHPQGAFADLVVGMFPENIFGALTTGNKIAILVFAVLFGVALGSIAREKSERATALLEAFYDTFIKIIEWLMYVLPFGLFCLAYSQVSAVGLDVLFAMTKLVVLIYAGAILLIVFYSVLIWLRVGGSYLATLGAMRETVVVAFGTSSSYASIPSALRGLKEGLRLDRRVVDLALPLGITLNPPGSTFHFALATLFLANLYGLALDPGQMVFVLFGAMLAGVAATGAPGVAALSMISIILVPLGLPVEVAIILLVAIDPIVDPILTVVNVQGNAATTALLAGKPEPVEGTVASLPPTASPESSV
jgi:Na+/H+-dicarboxylate symporter